MFSILLSGYVGLVHNRVQKTAHSEVDYDLALTLAKDARGLFTPETTTQEQFEIRASKTFDMLHQSISPRELEVWSDKQESVSVQEP